MVRSSSRGGGCSRRAPTGLNRVLFVAAGWMEFCLALHGNLIDIQAIIIILNYLKILQKNSWFSHHPAFFLGPSQHMIDMTEKKPKIFIFFS